MIAKSGGDMLVVFAQGFGARTHHAGQGADIGAGLQGGRYKGMSEIIGAQPAGDFSVE